MKQSWFRSLIKFALSIGMSFLILALLLQLFTTGVSDNQRPAVLPLLKSTSIGLFTAYLALYGVSLLVRAHRYRLLIGLAGEPSLPSMPQMMLVTGIRNMVVDMLPARLGELGYVGLLNRGYGVKLQHCISSLSLSVALDFIALFAIVVAIVASQFLGGTVSSWAVGALFVATTLVCLAWAGLFLVLPWCVPFIVSRYSESAHPIIKNGIQLLIDFNDSLQSVYHSGTASSVIAWSILIRLLKYSGFYLLFLAVTKDNFPELAALPVNQVVSALIGGEVAASLPIPAFMSFGVYEAGSVLVFKMLGVSELGTVLIVMLCVHILSQLIEYILGGFLATVFVWRSRKANRVNGSDVSENSAHSKNAVMESRLNQVSTLSTHQSHSVRPWVIISAILFTFSASVFFAYQVWSSSKLGSLIEPDSGARIASARAMTNLDGVKGFVVFSSNRSGNHDIFLRDLESAELRRITEHPNTETYPRISPDGRHLVFSRAHQVWVSQRNTVAWDVFLIELATGIEVKISANSTAPAWLNANEVTVLREGYIVEKIDIDSLERSVVFESGIGNQMPKGTKLHNPKLNPVSRQLVFTARQSAIGSSTGHWGTAIDSDGSHRAVYNGCELSWSADGERLFQVALDGEDGTNRFIEVDPETLQVSTLLNLSGEFTHEYWPKESNNGDYLVFGASRGEQFHEHDTQDYEIFLWKRGSDPSKAHRITFHTGNDNWPDVFIER